MSRAGWAAMLVLAAPLTAQVTPARPDSARPAAAGDSTRLAADSARRAADSLRARPVTPPVDPALAVDAEIRVALFELLHDRYVPAVSRLQAIAASPVALNEANAAGGLRGRRDMLFLLTESYYRLGMGEPFRNTAQQLLSSGAAGRYASLVEARLLLDAYRRGDFARATELARALDVNGAAPSLRGLGALITGLVAYQQRDFAGARGAFAAAQQAGAPYADYSRYMDALALLRSDTTQTTAAISALEGLAQGTSGEFADQARLTAAMLAYESERHEDAARLAAGIGQSSGLGAAALLTRAWALYKADQVGPAGEAFDQFATRYSQLPERDEARLMAAQALLQLGRTGEAARIFEAVADSTSTEVSQLQGRRAAMTEAARALVDARASGLLFLNDPKTGKTIALQDASEADRALIASAFADSAAVVGQVVVPDIITLGDVEPRLSSLGTSAGLSVPQKVFYTPVSASLDRSAYAQRSQALFDADGSVALARHQVDEQVQLQARQIALLRALQQSLARQEAEFASMEQRLAGVQDSLSRMATTLDAAAQRVRRMLEAQVSLTREYADENIRMIDSVRGSLAGMGETETVVLQYEAQTAGAYRQVADMLSGNIDRVVEHHPVLAQRDSLRARGARLAALLTETKSLLASARDIVAQELVRLESGETEAVRSARSALQAAEAQRQTAETRLVALVDAELNARAGELIAELRRDVEAAEFGSASAAFFQAIDAGRQASAPGAAGTRGAAGAGGAMAPAVHLQSPK